jgi:hypothetical protein
MGQVNRFFGWFGPFFLPPCSFFMTFLKEDTFLQKEI